MKLLVWPFQIFVSCYGKCRNDFFYLHWKFWNVLKFILNQVIKIKNFFLSKMHLTLSRDSCWVDIWGKRWTGLYPMNAWELNINDVRFPLQRDRERHRMFPMWSQPSFLFTLRVRKSIICWEYKQKFFLFIIFLCC